MITGHQWQGLIDGMLDAVLLVDTTHLRILSANRVMHALIGAKSGSLTGKSVVELAATPEDVFFWEEVEDGLSNRIFSETLLPHADGHVIPVERQVSLVNLRNSGAVYVISIRDLTKERKTESELEKLVAELRATQASTGNGLLVVDLDGAIRNYNQTFVELWDIPSEILDKHDDNAIYAWMNSCLIEGSDHAIHARHLSLLESQDSLVLRSGKVLERVTLPQYARGRPIGRVYSYRDVTEQLTSQLRLQLAAKVFESSTDAIFITDASQHIVSTNPSSERVTGYSEADMLGKSLQDIFTEEANPFPNGAQIAKLIAQSVETGSSEGELWNRHKDGRAYLCRMSLVRVPDEDGNTLNFIVFFRDRTETYTAKQKIEQLAFTDPLTGLPNRLLLNERVTQAISLADRNQDTFAILFLDLDNFKQINDSLGHQFGDRVLIQVTDRLKRCIRQVDTATRQGGDEFVLLVQQVDASGAARCARRVMEELSKPFELDDMEFTVTCSIGIALYPNDGACMDDLIKNADSAMYHVKARGRADFRFYQQDMNVGLLSRMKLDHAMRQAAEKGLFRLHYQPLVNIQSGQVVGAEALIRWTDADLGEVSPGEFIPLAEETGVIVAIGNWVMKTAIAQAAIWHKQRHDLRVSVNVSVLQFQQPDFVSNIAKTLVEYGLPADKIELELTESILIRDVGETLRKLEMLAQLGVKMAIDDFGTGYSSLSYLKRFPIHKLKIDRSFVQNLPQDESDIAIVTAIISLAHSLKLLVIAEGVETEQQQGFLRTLDCDELQGFLYAPALPVAEFECRYLHDSTLTPAVKTA
jgi:diguanylate cyclase (GGDEF)-like protein/PAS domain S-box-containing protein